MLVEEATSRAALVRVYKNQAIIATVRLAGGKPRITNIADWGTNCSYDVICCLPEKTLDQVRELGAVAIKQAQEEESATS